MILLTTMISQLTMMMEVVFMLCMVVLIQMHVQGVFDQWASATEDDGSCIYGAENIFLDNILDEYNLSSDESFMYFQSGTDLFSQGTSVYVQGTNLFTQGTSLLFYASTSLIEYIQSTIFGLFISLIHELYNCSFDCVNDVNNDGVCDELEVYGNLYKF